MRTTPSSRRTRSSRNGEPACIRIPSPKWASWYRLAPVDTIQSTNPDLTSGITQETPRPAGVSAPDSESPTVTPGRSIFSASSRAPSRSLPALYARKYRSIRSAANAPFGTGGGRILCPRKNRDDVFAISASTSREGAGRLPDEIDRIIPPRYNHRMENRRSLEKAEISAIYEVGKILTSTQNLPRALGISLRTLQSFLGFDR